MKSQIINSPSSLESLNSVLLATLDESVFFAQLSKYIQDQLKLDYIQAYKSLDDGSALLLTENGNSLKQEKLFKAGESLANYVIKTKRPYFCNNCSRDPLFSEIKRDERFLSELAIPVSSQGIVLATIHLLSKKESDFSQDYINQVQDILNSIKTPINNMKMYLSAKKLNESLLKKIEKREKELEGNKSNSTSLSPLSIKADNILGNSEAIKNLTLMAEKVAPTNSTILVLGPSGSGKELIARKIHCSSNRSNQAYVIVNCGAIQENLLESEFFGHEKGSFTGAIQTKQGLVEKADKGTLFLDEVAELSPAMQTKLLRFLEQGEAYKVGGTVSYKVNVRIISATNKDLKKEVEEGRFREDLYYRLNTITLSVPSLKDRQSDIIQLATHFLNEGRELNHQKSLTPIAIKILSDYHWPGNVRELKNVMERSFILSEGSFIDETQLTDLVNNQEVVVAPQEEYVEMTLSDLERKHICKTLDHLGGNKTKTAKILGITVKTLYNKLHSYGMIETRESLQ